MTSVCSDLTLFQENNLDPFASATFNTLGISVSLQIDSLNNSPFLEIYKHHDIGVFPKWSRTFIEFRESDKSLKHEWGLNLKILSLTCVLLVL